MTNNDGGSAYPETPLSGGHPGMSLRDYLAAKAMQGLLAAEAEGFGYGGETRHADLARESFKLADAMLKAREQ